MELHLPMRKLLLALVLCLAPCSAWAQCTGVFNSGTICGNLGSVAAPPSMWSVSTSVFGPTTTVSGDLASWIGTTGQQLGDSGIAVGSITKLTATYSPSILLISPVTSGVLTPRLLVGADLPNPAPTTLGGVESFTAPASQYITTITTS